MIIDRKKIKVPIVVQNKQTKKLEGKARYNILKIFSKYLDF